MTGASGDGCLLDISEISFWGWAVEDSNLM